MQRLLRKGRVLVAGGPDSGRIIDDRGEVFISLGGSPELPAGLLELREIEALTGSTFHKRPSMEDRRFTYRKMTVERHAIDCGIDLSIEAYVPIDEQDIQAMELIHEAVDYYLVNGERK